MKRNRQRPEEKYARLYFTICYIKSISFHQLFHSRSPNFKYPRQRSQTKASPIAPQAAPISMFGIVCSLVRPPLMKLTPTKESVPNTRDRVPIIAHPHS